MSFVFPVRKRAATGAPTLGFSLVGVELATIAFLVVFSLLIRDFFWIAMVSTSRLILNSSYYSALVIARDVPNRVIQKARIEAYDYAGLAPTPPQRGDEKAGVKFCLWSIINLALVNY
jgi:hypothetical protein